MTARSHLAEVLGVPFTDEQWAVVSAPLEPGLVVAGAGSGKTTVMAARVVHLVLRGEVAPESVLGLTFTNKAAAELAHRIRGALERAGVPLAGGGGADAWGGAGEPTVSTYHAFAGRLVTDHGLRLGVEPRSRLLADATRFQLAARVLQRYDGPTDRLTAPFSDLVEGLVALDGDLSEHLVAPGALRDFEDARAARLRADLQVAEQGRNTKTLVKELTAALEVAERRAQLAGVCAAYRAARAREECVDFGDQVALAARLAEQVVEVAEAERGRFAAVLLDEYQDTSVSQRRLLVGLFGAGHPVTAVGDPCQAIYGWRGASVANLDDFPVHFPLADGAPAPVRTLSVNQRSGGRLLALANRLAAPLRDRHRVVELVPPLGKELRGAVRVARHETWAQECSWVAEEVLRAHAQPRADGTPRAWSDVAVLVRARRAIGDLHGALVAAGVPVEVVGLGGLLALPEVADVVATLEVVDEPTANAALVRLLTGPRWRLGPRDLALLGARARSLLAEARPSGDASDGAADRELERAAEGVDPCDVVSLSDAVLDPGPETAWPAQTWRRLRRLGRELAHLQAHRDEPLLDLVHRVVDVTGLGVELASSPEAVDARRAEGVAAFLDVAAGFEDLEGRRSVSAFLAFLRAAQEHDRGLEGVGPSGEDAVAILTVHTSKGLEWDVVLVPDLTDTVFPATAVRGKWFTTATVLPAPLRGDAAGRPVPVPGADGVLDKAALADYSDRERTQQLVEERRLAYVAMTRARDLVVASSHHWGPTQKTKRSPSPYLLELRDHALEGHGEVVQWVEEPEHDANPALGATVRHDWPVPLDPGPLARRRAAARRVAQGRDALLAGEALPDEVTDDALPPGARALLARLDRDAELLLAEQRRARAAVRTVPLPTSLSASDLVRLRADPDAFARELARPMPRPPAPAARRGTRFHAWVEQRAGARPLLEPDDLPGAEDWGDAGGSGAADAELAALQEAFLAGPWAEEPLHAVEAAFSLPLGGRVVRGRIDAVVREGDRWLVVDWKTGQESADPLQLAIYRLAWARLQGVPPEQVDAAFRYVRTSTEQRFGAADLPGEAALVALLDPPDA